MVGKERVRLTSQVDKTRRTSKRKRVVYSTTNSRKKLESNTGHGNPPEAVKRVTIWKRPIAGT